MQCPRCQSLLVEGEYENEAAQFCEACGGVLIRQRSLRKILSALSTQFSETIDLHDVLPPVSDLGPVGECPDCQDQMDHYGYMESDKIMIDCCDTCNGLWVDPLEFVGMSKMYVQTNKLRNHYRSSRYRGADLVGAQAYAEAFTKAFLLGFISRSVF